MRISDWSSDVCSSDFFEVFLQDFAGSSEQIVAAMSSKAASQRGQRDDGSFTECPMSKILIAFYSRNGSTEALAKAVAEGAQAAGAEVRLRRDRKSTRLNSSH